MTPEVSHGLRIANIRAAMHATEPWGAPPDEQSPPRGRGPAADAAATQGDNANMDETALADTARHATYSDDTAVLAVRTRPPASSSADQCQIVPAHARDSAAPAGTR
jgi:hypothetical protein